MEELFLRFLSLSLGCTVVLIPLFLCAGVIGRRYTARTQYIVWLLMGVRLLAPVQFSLPQAPITISAPMYRLDLPAAMVGGVMPDLGEAGAPAAQSVTLTAVLAVVWAVGVVTFLLLQVGAYLLARRRVLRGAALDGSIDAPVRVYRSDRANTPMTLGFLRPVLVLPDRNLDSETLDVMVRHELCHLRRRDVLYKAFFLLVNAAHWFNPAVWLMARMAGQNLEFCCDDEVLRDADPAQRRQYGEVLLNAAAVGHAPALATRFGSPKGELKERLSNLFAEKKKGAALVCLLVVAVMAVGLLVVFRPAADDIPTVVTPAVAIPVETDGPDVIDNDSTANLAEIPQKQMGVDFPEIDYASEELLVFHDYWGLAVYDFRQCQIVRVLDIPAIGMNRIQGDQYTEVRVVKGLERIYLYTTPGDSEAYLYLLSGDTVSAVPPAQAQAEEKAQSGVAGEFFFPEGQEAVMANLTYRESDGTEWRLFDQSTDEWYWPLDGEYIITGTFYNRFHPITGEAARHTGTDVKAEEGTSVHAAQSGTVIFCGYGDELGNWVEIDHGDEKGTFTRYAQLESYDVVVGDTVEKGQVIGAVGSTGSSTGPHLHFEYGYEGIRFDALHCYSRLANKLVYI